MRCLKETGFPCGQCLPCSINARRIWTARLLLEANYHADIVFVTWTYENEGNGSLDKADFRKYLASIRTQYHRRKIFFRYYVVGEYGDQTGRPHYHAVLYGIPREEYDVLRETWLSRTHANQKVGGFVRFDLFSRDLAAYITGYVAKKWHKRGRYSEQRLDGREREFSLTSRRPGLGTFAIPDLVDAFGTAGGKELLESHGDIPSSLRFGGNVLPLGRFIRSHLRKHQGLSESGNEPESGALKRLERYREKVEVQAVQKGASTVAEAATLEKQNQEKIRRVSASRSRFLESLNHTKRKL